MINDESPTHRRQHPARVARDATFMEVELPRQAIILQRMPHMQPQS